ncbi:hypothetical protein FOXYSP1_15014 [Fusarium oxysporum f. sp. phaseoli]
MTPIGSQDCEDVATANRYTLRLIDIKYIRPKLVENTGSRPLSHSQAAKRWISSWVGDDQRIPGVVCFLPSSHSQSTMRHNIRNEFLFITV